MNNFLKRLALSYWLKLAILLVMYLLTAKFGLEMNAVSGFASLVWPPTGIAFAALCLFGFRLWPAIAIGAFLVNFWTGATVISASGMALGNTLEAIVGTLLFRKVAGKNLALDKIKDVLALVLGVAFLSTLVSATIGVTSLYMGGIVTRETLGNTWGAWWFGDAISNLVIAPVLLVWSRFSLPKLTMGKVLEGIALGASVMILSVLIFGPLLRPEVSQFIKAYWIFSLLIWATIRFGQHANTLLVIVVTTIAVWGTVHGYGPFQAESLLVKLLLLQLFICALAVTGLFFGALGREKEEALRLRSDFISIASHELKTPLTILKLQMQVLKSSLDRNKLGTDSEITMRAISTSDQQLDSLNMLVNTLLDTSQIESGKLAMERKEVDLTALISETVKSFNNHIKEVNCTLEASLELSVKGQWNSYRIEQVLINLLINAMKYGPGRPLKISLARRGDWARFSVQDFGIGISKENQTRIFNRFERVDTSKNIHGIGLGLYISKQIVEEHGGKIWVESEQGEGSTFFVDLPLQSES